MEGRREEKRMTEVSEHLGGNRMKKKKDNVRSRRTSGPASRFCIFHCGEYVYGARSLALSPLSLSLSLFLFLAEPRSFTEKLFIGGVS